jgi:hypothetical protein
MLSPQTPVFADTIKLIDGSILVGKIVKESTDSMIFSNAYGSFKIKLSNIIDINRTNDYTEDIDNLRKMGVNVNEGEIKRNVEAGQGKKLHLESVSKEIKGKAGNQWVQGRISVSGSYFYVPGGIGGRLPWGYSGHIALDQGLDMIPGKRHPMMPGIRFEGSYLHFNKGSYRISGYSAGGGLMWAMPSMNNKGGCFVFAVMPGASMIEIKNSYAGKRARSLTFTGNALAGYQVSFGVFSMFLHARYLYIYDQDVLFHSIGGECGFGFNAW